MSVSTIDKSYFCGYRIPEGVGREGVAPSLPIVAPRSHAEKYFSRRLVGTLSELPTLY